MEVQSKITDCETNLIDQTRYMINDGNLVLAFAIICSLSVTRIFLVVKVSKIIKFQISTCEIIP